MNLGKFQPLIAGTVVFFKQNSSMKKIRKFCFSYVLFILLLLVCWDKKWIRTKQLYPQFQVQNRKSDSTNKTNIPQAFDSVSAGNKMGR
jgi:hypothetical protein